MDGGLLNVQLPQQVDLLYSFPLCCPLQCKEVEAKESRTSLWLPRNKGEIKHGMSSFHEDGWWGFPLLSSAPGSSLWL